MATLVALLWLISLICLVVGLLFPGLFTFVFRSNPSRKKVGLTFGLSTLGLLVLFGIISPNKSSQTSTVVPTVTVTSIPSLAPTLTQTTLQKTSLTPATKPVVKHNIVITSMIVKKVAPTTYRYFFNVANQDQTDFKGDIFIQLFNGHDTPQFLIFGGATKSYSDSPIQAGTNSVTYIEDSHAPSQVDGIDGATTFTYSVSINGNEVNSGKDTISGQYENDLQQ